MIGNDPVTTTTTIPPDTTGNSCTSAGGSIDTSHSSTTELATKRDTSLSDNVLQRLQSGHLERQHQRKRRIFLIRHGETDWNRRGLIQGGGHDIPLNDRGTVQAQRAAHAVLEMLSAMGFNDHFGTNKNISNERSADDTSPSIVFACSPLQRAHGTASIIHREVITTWLARSNLKNSDLLSSMENAHELQVLPEFSEMRFGSLEGVALYGEESTDRIREVFHSHTEEMKTNLDHCWPGENGESLRTVQERALRGLTRLYEMQPTVPTIIVIAHGRFNRILLAILLYDDARLYHRITQDNACINVIDQYHDGTYHPVILNYVDHLDDESSGPKVTPS